MPTLFEIGEDIRALETFLEDIGGDVTDEQAEAQIDAWLEENEKALESKLDGYCSLIRNREAWAKARKEEEDRLKSLRKTDENIVSSLKSRLLVFFNMTGRTKAETLRFKIWTQKNGTAPFWFNEDLYGGERAATLPPSYQKTLIVPDMEAIRFDALRLKQLQEVEELNEEQERELDSLTTRLEGIAKVLPAGNHLRIK